MTSIMTVGNDSCCPLLKFDKLSISHLLGTVTTQWLDSDGLVIVDNRQQHGDYTVDQLCMTTPSLSSHCVATMPKGDWWNMSLAVYDLIYHQMRFTMVHSRIKNANSNIGFSYSFLYVRLWCSSLISLLAIDVVNKLHAANCINRWEQQMETTRFSCASEIAN